MAQAKIEIIHAIRNTAKKLSDSNDYMWGHMGSCNCGHLAQEITKRTKAEIHALAMRGHGDWNEQLNDYCGMTQMPIDLVIHEMLTAGFSVEDLQQLERLSNPEILKRLSPEKRILKHNLKADVVVYLNEWANMLEEKLLSEIRLPNFLNETIIPEHA